MKVLMPQIGMTMVEAVITEWKVATGDTVKKGDVIAEILTEKLTEEIESPADGTITLMAGVEDTVAFGEVIAEIE